MGAVENKKLILDIFAELAKGNAGPFVEAMADDFQWQLMGRKSWTQSFHGKPAVLKDLFGMLNARLEGNIVTTAERIIADGDFVAVEALGNSKTKTGRPYRNAYCFVFRVQGGKLKEVREYMDTELATETFGGA
ncbi:MAG TPA: nuclear transport factor 2 family protein [Candidatus Acidoferrales bacterium]|nr:nuclear transport factor 2 family protein [Candidatus Acidoferrales bacterium]